MEPEGDRHVYCGNCGSLVQAGDRFCGVCGARITPTAQDAGPAQEIPPQVPPPPSSASRERNRGKLFGLTVGMLLLLLLVGGGVLALNGLGQLPDLLGGTGSGSPTVGSTNGSNSNSVPPDAPPDPAFDSLLPTLQSMTDVPIMLPAKLPDDMDMVAIDGYASGNALEYGLVFTYGPTERIAQPSNAQTLGKLTGYPNDEDVANEFFDAERIEEVTLPDGTEATLRYMVPAGRSGSQGPFWEGKFDKNDFTYKLTVTKPEEIAEDEVKQALSTIVSVPPSEELRANQPDSEEGLLEEFGRDYYEASSREDWETTYSMLSEDSQQQFTEEEWAEKQQILRDNQGPVPPLEGVTVESNEQVSDSPATVTLTYGDGAEEEMTVMIPMAVEDESDAGVPKRYLTEEEISDLGQLAAFGSTFGSTSGSTVPSTDNSEAGAEEAATEYYQAAGIEDWTYTYEHLDSETQTMFTEEEWAQKNQYYWDQNETIYDILSVDMVSDTEEPTTEVVVRITGEDGSSFIRTTYWVLEDGWLHRFSQEEIDSFMPDLSYEEFVEAQVGTTSGSSGE